jgi:hypothetical protein
LRSRPRTKLVLIVIDGLSPSVLEAAIERGAAPALAQLVAAGEYGHAVSTFPSLTPVCLSSIATGAHPNVHEIPHLVWWHREEKRLVEYGSSFSAIRAAGLTRSLLDTIFDMNRRHLGAGAVTLYEALEAAGFTTAAINITCYRGSNRHVATLPGLPPAYGPRRFFFYSLFESDFTGAPIAVWSRERGSIDAYAAAVGRWLVTRDGFDFLVYYLPDYDYASHAVGPTGADEALARADAAVAALFDSAGGFDEFVSRYAVILCADHGQTPVLQVTRLRAPGALVAASNRAAMAYGDDPRALAETLVGQDGVELAVFLEDGEVVALRNGEEGIELLDDYPNGDARVTAALENPNAGDVLVSAAPGWEFADLAGCHHLGGGSHGSLAAADSIVPMLTLGLGPPPTSITGIAPLVLSHFGVGAPAYARVG